MIEQRSVFSFRQTVLSLVILGALIGIGLGIFMAQNQPNPAVEAIAQLSTADVENGRSRPPGSTQSLFDLPEQMMALSPPETFDRVTLSDKINGKAEMYLSAGFVGLTSQRLRSTTNEDLWFEAFVYDMDRFENAYAVFSQQRREDAESLTLTRYAYRTPNALFLVHGPYYLEVIGSSESRQLADDMLALARSYIQAHPVAASSITEKELFPAENLVPDSVMMIATDAFGYGRLDRVFTATYRLNGAELTAFLSRRSDDDEARKLAADYETFLVNFGGEAIETDGLPSEEARVISILDTIEIVFPIGRYVAGVREAPDPETARTLAVRLAAHLKEATREP